MMVIARLRYAYFVTLVFNIFSIFLVSELPFICTHDRTCKNVSFYSDEYFCFVTIKAYSKFLNWIDKTPNHLLVSTCFLCLLCHVQNRIQLLHYCFLPAMQQRAKQIRQNKINSSNKFSIMLIRMSSSCPHMENKLPYCIVLVLTLVVFLVCRYIHLAYYHNEITTWEK